MHDALASASTSATPGDTIPTFWFAQDVSSFADWGGHYAGLESATLLPAAYKSCSKANLHMRADKPCWS